MLDFLISRRTSASLVWHCNGRPSIAMQNKIVSVQGIQPRSCPINDHQDHENHLQHDSNKATVGNPYVQISYCWTILLIYDLTTLCRCSCYLIVYSYPIVSMYALHFCMNLYGHSGNISSKAPYPTNNPRAIECSNCLGHSNFTRWHEITRCHSILLQTSGQHAVPHPISNFLGWRCHWGVVQVGSPTRLKQWIQATTTHLNLSGFCIHAALRWQHATMCNKIRRLCWEASQSSTWFASNLKWTVIICYPHYRQRNIFITHNCEIITNIIGTCFARFVMQSTWSSSLRMYMTLHDAF